jgi:hypothetical protein
MTIAALDGELADDLAVGGVDARDGARRVVVERRDLRQVAGEGEQHAAGGAEQRRDDEEHDDGARRGGAAAGAGAPARSRGAGRRDGAAARPGAPGAGARHARRTPAPGASPRGHGSAAPTGPRGTGALTPRGARRVARDRGAAGSRRRRRGSCRAARAGARFRAWYGRTRHGRVRPAARSGRPRGTRRRGVRRPGAHAPVRETSGGRPPARRCSSSGTAVPVRVRADVAHAEVAVRHDRPRMPAKSVRHDRPG